MEFPFISNQRVATIQPNPGAYASVANGGNTSCDDRGLLLAFGRQRFFELAHLQLGLIVLLLDLVANARGPRGGYFIQTLLKLIRKYTQSILFLLHWFIYKTWVDFRAAPYPRRVTGLALVVAVLSITYFVANRLIQHYSNWFVRFYYKVTMVWFGFMIFFFLAAALSWIAYGGTELLALHWQRQSILFALFGAAFLVGMYGLLNSTRVHVKQISVELPNLPVAWRGRVAALVADLHLGHVRGCHFAKRIVNMLIRFHPDIVLIAGDMFDSTAAEADDLAEPWVNLSTPLGTYFVSGNQEEVSDSTKYLEAVRKFGVRVLNNEKEVVDGLQIVGVRYCDSVDPSRFRAILQKADLDAEKASILLTHAPNQLPIAAEEKIGLQLSGHTHGGQFFPFTWLMAKTYGPFVYGLKRLGNLTVYTSCGVGTWGPPIRVGTQPEIVLISFDC